MPITSDPNDPRLTRGVDTKETNQAEVYLVLSEDERNSSLARPVRMSYTHSVERGGCGIETTMNWAIAETYAKDPGFYGATYCIQCKKHLPVEQFVWKDGSVVGT